MSEANPALKGLAVGGEILSAANRANPPDVSWRVSSARCSGSCLAVRAADFLPHTGVERRLSRKTGLS